MKRRTLLRSLGGCGTVVTLSGCLGTSGPQGEGTTVEIIPSNMTGESITVSVMVYSPDDETLLDHTYELASGKADESQGVANDVGYLAVSLNGNDPVRHNYSPDLDGSCEGEDVQILVKEGSIEFAYSC